MKSKVVSSWRPREVFREGLRNAQAQPSQLVLMTVLIFIVLGIFSYGTVAHSLDRERSNELNGTYVWVATAMGSDGMSAEIDTVRCEQLDSNAAVLAAAHMGGSRDPLIWQLFSGSSGIPSRIVSPSLPTVFGVSEFVDAPTLGRELVRLGLVLPGQTLWQSGSDIDLRVEAALTTDLPLAAANSALLIPRVVPGRTEECLIRLDRAGYAYGRELLSAAFPEIETAVTPFRDSSLDLSPRQQFVNYVNLFPGVIAGAAAGFVLLALMSMRRSKLMVYRTFGTSKSTLGMILTVEAVVAIVFGATIAMPVAWISAAWLFGVTAAAQASLVAGLHILCAAFFATAVVAFGSSLVVMGDPIRAMRDR